MDLDFAKSVVPRILEYMELQNNNIDYFMVISMLSNFLEAIPEVKEKVTKLLDGYLKTDVNSREFLIGLELLKTIARVNPTFSKQYIEENEITLEKVYKPTVKGWAAKILHNLQE
jgi:hypothetical protein